MRPTGPTFPKLGKTESEARKGTFPQLALRPIPSSPASRTTSRAANNVPFKTIHVRWQRWRVLIARRPIRGGVRFGEPGIRNGLSPKPLRARQPAASPVRVPAHRALNLAQKTHPRAQLTLMAGRLLRTLSAQQRKRSTSPPSKPTSRGGSNAIFPSRLHKSRKQTTARKDIPHCLQVPRMGGRNVRECAYAANFRVSRTFRAPRQPARRTGVAGRLRGFRPPPAPIRKDIQCPPRLQAGRPLYKGVP